MNLGLIIDSWEGTFGLRKYTNEIIRGLLEYGRNFDCLTLIYSTLDSQLESIIEKNHNREIEINLLKINLPSIPFSKHLRQTILLPNLLKKQKIDIVHDLYQMGPFLFDCNQYKKILTVHDVIPLLYPPSRVSDRLLTEINYRMILPKIIQKSDAIITPSHNTKNDLVKYLKVPQDKIHVIYSGVDMFKFRRISDISVLCEVKSKYGIKSESRKILGFVSDSQIENTPKLIHAYKDVAEKIPGTQLILVGPKYKECTKIANDLGIGKNVIFTGYVPENDLVALYSICDVFVFPSLYEGFGFPPLEAMSCGIPVITSKVSSIPEVVGDAAILIDPTIKESIADAILNVIVDENAAKHLICRGKHRAMKFSWQNTISKISDLYADILNCRVWVQP